MKFRFCGDLDCPDWVLAEIAVLAKLTSIKFRMLCQVICQGIVDGKIQKEKANKILFDVGMNDAESKGCLASVTFILKSAAKYECNSASLTSELQQLGLPSELAQQICKIYDDNQTKIKSALEKDSFTMPRLSGLKGEISQTDDGVQFGVLNLTFDDGISAGASIAVSKQNLDLLLKDVTEAVGIMDQLQASSR